MFVSIVVVAVCVMCLLEKSSASNFRGDLARAQEGATIPLDDARAERVAKYFMESVHSRAAKDHNESKKMVEDVHKEIAKLSKEETAAKVAASKTASKQIASGTGLGDEVRFGSFVVRHRPNGDCSGTPSTIVADQVFGACNSYYGYESYYLTCQHENDSGEVIFMKHGFYNGDCSGEPAYTYTVGDSGPRCYMEVNYPAPATMKTRQCARKNYDEVTTQGGILYKKYSDSHCESAITGEVLQTYNACEMVVEYFDDNGYPVDNYGINKYTRYHYASVTGCSHDGRVTVTGFSDRACTRPIYQGRYQITGYGICHYESMANSYVRTVCAPAGGH